jgi:hypothetical protein
MNVELLIAPGCPNASAARALLTVCLRRVGLDPRVRERVGELPSPTILVDGIDVMTGREGSPPMSACRLDLPTESRVLAALSRAGEPADRQGCAMTARIGGDLPQPIVGVVSTRIRGLSPAARALHTAILRAFATTGRPANPATLAAATPAGHDPQVLLGELHDRDVVRLDGQGRIRATYPFSAVPTAHRVAIGGGPTVYAMCAIDALGIADMLTAEVSITSTDPRGAQPIRIRVRPGGQATWQPDTTVVIDGTTATDSGGPAGAAAECTAAADRCCGVMNFFTNTESAAGWLANHPHISGVILTQEQALRLGVDIFGHLLDD